MTFEIYRDNNGEWRWRLVARNRRIIADSGEGYKRKGKAVSMVRKITQIPSPTIVYVGYEEQGD